MNHTATATRTTKDGTTITPAGPYEVHLRDLSAGLPLFRVEVLHAGSNQLHGDDHRSFPTRETAEHYRDALVGCLNDEHEGISDERIAEVAAGVNANMDRTEGQYAAKVQADRAIGAEVMAGSRGFRGDRKTLAETVPAPVGRPVRNTKTGVFRKPLNELQQRVVDRAHNGRIHVGQGVPTSTMRAIADKGHGVLVMDPVVRFRVIGLDLDLTSKER